MISRETLGAESMKWNRGFAEATIATVLNQAGPLVDMFTGGKFSQATALTAEKAAMTSAAFRELADVTDAVEAALTAGATAEKISAIFNEAAEAKEAIKLIKGAAKEATTAAKAAERATPTEDAGK